MAAARRSKRGEGFFLYVTNCDSDTNRHSHTYMHTRPATGACVWLAAMTQIFSERLICARPLLSVSLWESPPRVQTSSQAVYCRLCHNNAANRATGQENRTVRAEVSHYECEIALQCFVCVREDTFYTVNLHIGPFCIV